jgi:hypothetical protein
MYKLEIEEVGTGKIRSTKHQFNEAGAAMRKRNSLAAFMARRYGDGVYLVRVVLEVYQYHVYDRDGNYRGTYPEEKAAKLVAEKEDWTMSLVK